MFRFKKGCPDLDPDNNINRVKITDYCSAGSTWIILCIFKLFVCSGLFKPCLLVMMSPSEPQHDKTNEMACPHEETVDP